MGVRVTDLMNHPDLVPHVAAWIYDEFWSDKEELSSEDLAGLLAMATQRDRIPLSLLAWIDDVPVGTVNLIENDDSKRPHLSPWLAALYVRPEYRLQGVARALVSTIQERSKNMGIQELFLGTDNPAFYRNLGATLHERVDDTMVVMRLKTVNGIDTNA